MAAPPTVQDITGKICHGVIERIPNNKTYGFIKVFACPEIKQESIFFHFSSINESIIEIGVGDEVEFTLIKPTKQNSDKDGWNADNILILEKGSLEIERLESGPLRGEIVHSLTPTIDHRHENGDPFYHEPTGGQIKYIQPKDPTQSLPPILLHSTQPLLFEFSGRDLDRSVIYPPKSLQNTLHPGRPVIFQLYSQLVPHHRDRQFFATNVTLVKHLGIIDRISTPKPYNNGSPVPNQSKFGWIKFLPFLEPERDEIFFNFKSVSNFNQSIPEVGDEVQFDILVDQKNRDAAAHVTFLPKGTCSQFLDLYVCEGLVIKSPILHLPEFNQRDKRDAYHHRIDRDSNRFLHGLIEFENPLVSGEILQLVPFLRSAQTPRDVKPSDRIIKGDTVVFDLLVYRNDCSKMYISNVKVCLPTYKSRVLGVVHRFTLPFHHPNHKFKGGHVPKVGVIKVPEPSDLDDVFFHEKECTNPHELQEGSFVEFDVTQNSKKKTIAVRMEVKDKDQFSTITLIKEDISGRVVRNRNNSELHRNYKWAVEYSLDKMETERRTVILRKKYEMIEEHALYWNQLEKGTEVTFSLCRDVINRMDVIKNMRFKKKPEKIVTTSYSNVSHGRGLGIGGTFRGGKLRQQNRQQQQQSQQKQQHFHTHTNNKNNHNSTSTSSSSSPFHSTNNNNHTNTNHHNNNNNNNKHHQNHPHPSSSNHNVNNNNKKKNHPSSSHTNHHHPHHTNNAPQPPSNQSQFKSSQPNMHPHRQRKQSSNNSTKDESRERSESTSNRSDGKDKQNITHDGGRSERRERDTLSRSDKRRNHNQPPQSTGSTRSQSSTGSRGGPRSRGGSRRTGSRSDRMNWREKDTTSNNNNNNKSRRRRSNKRRNNNNNNMNNNNNNNNKNSEHSNNNQSSSNNKNNNNSRGSPHSNGRNRPTRRRRHQRKNNSNNNNNDGRNKSNSESNKNNNRKTNEENNFNKGHKNNSKKNETQSSTSTPMESQV